MTPSDLLQFLRQHRLAVVSTVSSRGEPQSALLGVAVTDRFELIFDTVDSSRKFANLKHSPKVSAVIGWEGERTVQFEGIADQPQGEALESLLKQYFAVFADGPERRSWQGIAYFRVRPTWIRFSDFNPGGGIVEFSASQLGI